MSNFEEERIKYRDKVSRQKEAVSNLLALADKHSGLFDYAMVSQLRNSLKKCEKIYRKLDKNEFEIAIVGLEKAGKSTFGNALMENRILPDADKRCTYTSTCIRYGDDRAVVKFFSAAEMNNTLRRYLKVLGVENPESYTYKELSKSDYTLLFNGLDPRDRERFENTVNQDILNLLENKNSILSEYVGREDRIFEGEDLYEEEFQKYIVSPEVAVAVKEVSIESSKLGKLENAVIYDVPGFDSPTKMHSEQTKERMKEADAIILIASAEKPSITAPSLDMFQEVVDEDNVSLSDKLFIFGNRADAANTLGENIETLKDEAIKWNLLKSSQIDERLIIGSSKAHLQKIGVVEGNGCISKIEEGPEGEAYKKVWKHGDGILYTIDKLSEYNENERFPIIKKKIRRNEGELRSLVKELEEKYGDNGFEIDYSTLLSERSNLNREAKDTIKDDLERMREEIRNKYNQESILSKRLQDEVSKLFADEEKYAIDQEDIENAQLKVVTGVTSSVNVEAVEERIREAKFSLIYDDFSRSAFSVAQKDHAEYYRRIVECFENALKVNNKGSNYDKLHGIITGFIEKYKKSDEDEFIYQSVIERFVRDVVEVLIRYPYGLEARLNKFVAEAEIFSGLVMFYNPGDANEGYKRQFLSVAPKNQPLLLSLVFHDYKEADECSGSAMDYIGGINKALCENTEIVQLVFSIIKRNPVEGADAIRKMSKEKFRECKSEGEQVRQLVPLLREIKNKMKSEGKNENDNSTKKYDFDFTDRSEFEKQYKQFFGNQDIRTYDNVIEFFKVDLEILEKFLIHASIPAIKLEKPFVAREVQSINKLLKAVNSEEFDKMINDNVRLLLPRACKDSDQAVLNSFANRAAVGEVKKILETLSDNETA